MSESKTPRTEAIVQHNDEYVVDADFARTIELELREAIDGWKKQTEMYEAMEKERDELKKLANGKITLIEHIAYQERDEWKACAEELAKVVNSFRWLAVNSDNHKFPEYREMIDDLNRIAEVDITRFNKLKGEKK